jgi:hypothetical protein
MLETEKGTSRAEALRKQTFEDACSLRLRSLYMDIMDMIRFIDIRNAVSLSRAL